MKNAQHSTNPKHSAHEHLHTNKIISVLLTFIVLLGGRNVAFIFFCGDKSPSVRFKFKYFSHGLGCLVRQVVSPSGIEGCTSTSSLSTVFIDSVNT